MADNYKILAQTTAASVEPNSGLNQANVVYIVPENTQAAVSSVSLINSSATNEVYYLGVVRASDVNASSTTLPYTVGSALYVAVTDTGRYSTSTDGITWTLRGDGNIFPGESGWNFQAVAYGNDRFVAVGTSSAPTAVSVDGITWTRASSQNSLTLAYGNSKFVAIQAFGSTASYSTDGITWSTTSLPVSAFFRALVYADDKFVAAGNTTAGMYSTDAVTWIQTAMPANGIWRLAYGANRFVAISLFGAAYSADGIAWTQTTLPAAETNWSSVTYGNGKFVAVATGGNVAAYSTNGITWTQSTLPTNSAWISVTYGDGKFVAVSSGTVAAYSTDGITWTQSANAPGFWSAVTFGDSLQELEANAFAISNAQTIIPTRSIEPNTVDEITGGITLSAGDQIRVYSESEDLIVQVYGVELS